jgi:hypothetical protein
MAMSDGQVTVFRPRGVSYLRIPADQPPLLAASALSLSHLWLLDQLNSIPVWVLSLGKHIGGRAATTDE